MHSSKCYHYVYMYNSFSSWRMVCHPHKFADDTSLYLIVEDPVTAADLMDTDLDKIHTWADT